MSAPGQRFYDEDEAEEILHLAASISSSDGKMSYERLLETAAELGITPEAVEAAEKKVVSERQDRLLKAQFAAAQRQALVAHLISYVSVQVGLFAINMLTSPHELWFYWPMLAWGIGLFTHALSYLFPNRSHYNTEFAKWKATKDSSINSEGASSASRGYGPNVVVGVHLGGRSYEERLQDRLERAKARIDRIESRSRINRL